MSSIAIEGLGGVFETACRAGLPSRAPKKYSKKYILITFELF
jgi:hypothetical protein